MAQSSAGRSMTRALTTTQRLLLTPDVFAAHMEQMSERDRERIMSEVSSATLRINYGETNVVPFTKSEGTLS